MKERDNVGPSDVFLTVGSDSRINEVRVAISNGASSVNSVRVPFGPPVRIKV